MDFKVCSKCGELREANTSKNGFRSRSKSSDGLDSICRVCDRIRTAEWRSKPENKVRSQQWRQNNKDSLREYEKRWRERNPEKAKQLNRQCWRNRRAREKGVDREFYFRLDIYDRDNGLCQVEECLCPDGREIHNVEWDAKDPWCFEVDHIVLISLGGSDTLDNVRAAHRKCNASRGGYSQVAKDEIELLSLNRSVVS